MDDPQLEIEKEFSRAEQARSRGNEGQARVCARRAAGIAAHVYFTRRGEQVHTPSAYDLLQRLAADTTVSEQLRQSATYLTLRVNEEFKLPLNIDLILVARELCTELLK